MRSTSTANLSACSPCCSGCGSFGDRRRQADPIGKNSRLGGSTGTDGRPTVQRPKGMHPRTYDRLVAELFAAMDHHEVIFNIGAARILASDLEMQRHLFGRG
jgi:hypothetical protein